MNSYKLGRRELLLLHYYYPCSRSAALPQAQQSLRRAAWYRAFALSFLLLYMWFSAA